MAEEIKKVISIDTSESTKSVKELTEQVEKLRSILKTLDTTSDEYKATLDELKTAQDSLTASLKGIKEIADKGLEIKANTNAEEVKSNIEGLAGSIKDVQTQAEKGFTLKLGEAPKTVKELKAEIGSLKDALLNLTPGTDEYSEAIKRLVADQEQLNTVMNASKTVLGAAEGSYNQLTARMSALKVAWKATNDEATRADLTKEIKGINDQLKALDSSIGNSQRNVGNYAGSFQALKQEIKDARDVMAGAARGSDEYAAAAKRAAEASNQLRDMQKEIALGSSGLDNRFAVTSNIIGSISGGFAAAQGAMALFGAESENLQKTFVKLQAAMSMTQGFKALAELPKGLNAAKIAFGGVTKGVKAFTTSLKGVKGAIAATGIGVLLVLLGELIANWDAVTEAVENFTGGLDHLREVFAGVANVIKNFVTGPLNAIKLAFEGKWKEAAEAIKKGFSVAVNYSAGAAAQTVKNTEKAEQKKRAEYDKTKEDYIKDMEAQKGADWKYTKEGQKAYQDLFANRLKMYKKDTEEYKKAQREMWNYQRELSEKSNTKINTTGPKNTKKEVDLEAKAREEERERLIEWINERFKFFETESEEEKRVYEENVENYKKSLQEKIITQEEYDELMEKEESRHNDVIKKINNDTAKLVLAKLEESGENAYKDFSKTVTEYLFPTEKEFELAAREFNLEGAYSKYLNFGLDKIVGGFLNWDRKTIYGFFQDIGREIQKLDAYSAGLNGTIEEMEKSAPSSMRSYARAVDDAVEAIETLKQKEIEYSVSTWDLASGMAKLRENIPKDVWGSFWEEAIIKQLEAQEKGEDGSEAYYNSLLENAKEYLYTIDGINQEEIDIVVRSCKEKGSIQGKYYEEYRAAAEKYEKEIGDLSKRQIEDYENLMMQSVGTVRSFTATLFSWYSEKGEEVAKMQIESNQRELAAFIATTEEKIAVLQEELAVEGITDEQIVELRRQAEELKRQEIEKTAEIEQRNAEISLESVKKAEEGKRQLYKYSTEVIGNSSEIMMNWSEALSKKYVKDGEWMNKEKEKQAKTMFNVSKGLAISETVISTYQGAQEAYTSLASIPYVGPALGIAAALAAITAGIARVQQITSQKFGDSSVSNSSSSMNYASAVAVPQLEQTPYNYTSVVTNAEDEDKLNQPVIVQISDVEDALKIKDSRKVETSF